MLWTSTCDPPSIPLSWREPQIGLNLAKVKKKETMQCLLRGTSYYCICSLVEMSRRHLRLRAWIESMGEGRKHGK